MFDPKKIDLFPSQPGVYMMKNSKGEIIYVGKAKDIKSRVKQYFVHGRDTRAMIPVLLEQIEHIDTLIASSEKEALLLENTLIKKHQPKFNVLLKDDKTFIGLFVNNKNPWPAIRLIRYKGAPPKDGLYFGPYTSALAAREVLELLQRLFPLRQCSDSELQKRTRPCILYSIKKCIAPCVQKCSKEEYDSFVDGAVQFLKGKNQDIVKKLSHDMQVASEALEYEKAAAYLRTIRQIEAISSPENVLWKAYGKNSDGIGLYRSGSDVTIFQLLLREGKLIGSNHYNFSHVAGEDSELLSSFLLQNYKLTQNLPEEIILPISPPDQNIIEEIFFEMHKKKVRLLHPVKGEKRKIVDLAEENAKAVFTQQKSEIDQKEKLLLDMQEKFHLNSYPKRIECFDISHISGSDTVACMVAFTEADRDTKRMRYFHIKNIQASDDYGALRQALARHLTKAKEKEDLPDLLIIDGGKGQLQVALDILQELDIISVDAIGIAKDESRHDKGMTQEKVFIKEKKDPILPGARSPLLFFLQKVRDEAHRVAIGFHRRKRQKRMITSSLDGISGIGPKKRKILLSHFGSVRKLEQATIEDLQRVEGLSKKDISTLLEFIRKRSQ